MNPPVDGISQSCHALTRKICSISEPFRGQAVSVFYIFTCTWMGEGRCTSPNRQEVLQLHWISSCIFHRFNIASRIYRGKLATKVLPWRKGSPFSRKIIRCEGDESWNFRNEIGEISLRFSALETFNARKIWFRLPQRGNSGCFRIYPIWCDFTGSKLYESIFRTCIALHVQGKGVSVKWFLYSSRFYR